MATEHRARIARQTPEKNNQQRTDGKNAQFYTKLLNERRLTEQRIHFGRFAVTKWTEDKGRKGSRGDGNVSENKMTGQNRQRLQLSRSDDAHCVGEILGYGQRPRRSIRGRVSLFFFALFRLAFSRLSADDRRGPTDCGGRRLRYRPRRYQSQRLVVRSDWSAGAAAPRYYGMPAQYVNEIV